MKLKKLFLALVSLAILSSCNMMKEDEDLTNCGLFVTFKYDYNLQHSDMFGDHVGGVTLYVFDSDGRYLRSYEDNDIPSMGMMLDGNYVHAMQILDLPAGKYRFIALANQKSYDATLSTLKVQNIAGLSLPLATTTRNLLSPSTARPVWVVLTRWSTTTLRWIPSGMV